MALLLALVPLLCSACAAARRNAAVSKSAQRTPPYAHADFPCPVPWRVGLPKAVSGVDVAPDPGAAPSPRGTGIAWLSGGSISMTGELAATHDGKLYRYNPRTNELTTIEVEGLPERSRAPGLFAGKDDSFLISIDNHGHWVVKSSLALSEELYAQSSTGEVSATSIGKRIKRHATLERAPQLDEITSIFRPGKRTGERVIAEPGGTRYFSWNAAGDIFAVAAMRRRKPGKQTNIRHWLTYRCATDEIWHGFPIDGMFSLRQRRLIQQKSQPPTIGLTLAPDRCAMGYTVKHALDDAEGLVGHYYFEAGWPEPRLIWEGPLSPGKAAYLPRILPQAESPGGPKLRALALIAGADGVSDLRGLEVSTEAMSLDTVSPTLRSETELELRGASEAEQACSVAQDQSGGTWAVLSEGKGACYHNTWTACPAFARQLEEAGFTALDGGARARRTNEGVELVDCLSARLARRFVVPDYAPLDAAVGDTPADAIKLAEVAEAHGLSLQDAPLGEVRTDLARCQTHKQQRMCPETLRPLIFNCTVTASLSEEAFTAYKVHRLNLAARSATPPRLLSSSADTAACRSADAKATAKLASELNLDARYNTEHLIDRGFGGADSVANVTVVDRLLNSALGKALGDAASIYRGLHCFGAKLGSVVMQCRGVSYTGRRP